MKFKGGDLLRNGAEGAPNNRRLRRLLLAASLMLAACSSDAPTTDSATVSATRSNTVSTSELVPTTTEVSSSSTTQSQPIESPKAESGHWQAIEPPFIVPEGTAMTGQEPESSTGDSTDGGVEVLEVPEGFELPTFTELEVTPVSSEYVPGSVIGQLTIPELGLTHDIIAGVDEADLSRGIGFHTDTARLDAINGRSVLAGHNVTPIDKNGTLTNVLKDLDEILRVGGLDPTEIILTTGGVALTYIAIHQMIVPNNLAGYNEVFSPSSDVPTHEVVLYKCWPDGQTDHRYVVVFGPKT